MYIKCQICQKKMLQMMVIIMMQSHHPPHACFPHKDAPGASTSASHQNPNVWIDFPLTSLNPQQVSTLTTGRTLSLWNCCPWAEAWGAGVWPCMPAGPWAWTAGLWWWAGPPWTAGLEVCPWPALFWAALGTWRNTEKMIFFSYVVNE